MTKIKIVFVAFLLSLVIACVTFPPEKDFVTELWFIDPVNHTISRLNDQDELITYNFEDLDPEVWVTIKIEHITKEWKYQELLKKSCEMWR